MRRSLSAVLAGLLCLAGAFGPAVAEPKHAIAMHGEPALPADFKHFPYVNPDAPKGGRIDYAWSGTFDSINPFIVQGSAARGTLDLVFGYNVFDSLMQRSSDEPFTLYPLLAKTVETDDDRTFVEFTLDERARFSDGQPVTPEDVIFTIELLRDKGHPRYAVTAKKIGKMEKVGERGLRITFRQPDRELPLILGLMPILPKQATDAERFDKSTLKPMIGSGPYRLESVRPGDSITLRRNPDYWAKDIPSKVGFDNYDEIRLTYFRDENAMFEAFKKGLVDVFIDGSSGRWKHDYDFAAVKRGDVVQETFKTQLASGMFGFVMNSRRPQFQDRALREALVSLFDFEWANRSLLSSAYTRTKSFYDNSELSSFERPASEAEKALLAPFPDAVTPEVMANGWRPPASDGSGRDRDFLRVGFDKLKAAGYTIEDGRMVDKNGAPLAFEVMLKGQDSQQLAMAWQQTLARLGIDVTIRSVDAAQYQQRLNQFDFDVIAFAYPSSLSPGVEQVARWGSAARDQQGTWNFAGAANPAADALIDTLLKARDRDSFIQAVRAYDRVLMSGSYVVPLYFLPEQWVARWSRIKHPEKTPIYGYQLPTWWREEK
ncbi:ABC transporter substrate-binding protein [Mesorhizobium sp. L-8-10]|uniref:extracellular solute-binding protein n=1 Tax=Mesorhizobium sp. L-8-10 TaxID=2744523 RepID=UPI0019252B18|nr:extracellular solute-binding protein [Mesorhizobium sp. L-8-10]BCH32845.1 ABC transporter substrate-binding protein [Mesorhizobium sp. L-8-10]